MKCGQFEERNSEYELNFSVEKYFRNLIYGSLSEENVDKQGKGKVIFDVGAHKGESAVFFSALLPEASIYSFEPVPESARLISRLDLSNVKVFELALSNYNGKSDFNVQDISHLSSLRNINRGSKYSLGYANKEEHTQINVDVIRGDAFVSRHRIDVIDFLKIDVQANEESTIEGFSSVIDRIKSVFVEVSFYALYDNRSAVENIEKLLPGFRLFDIYEISKNPRNLGTDWATLVYVNSMFEK